MDYVLIPSTKTFFGFPSQMGEGAEGRMRQRGVRGVF
jgi:hypothetical protein